MTHKRALTRFTTILGCLALLITGLSVPPASAATSDDIDLGVFYMPGWNPAFAAQGGDAWWDIKQPQASPETRDASVYSRRPLQGWYDEQDPDVINNQLNQMADAGFDFVTYDWFWRGGDNWAVDGKPDLDAAVTNYLKAPARNRLSYALAYWGNTKVGEPTSEEEWDQMFTDLINTHLRNPQYKTLHGKPVFYIATPDWFKAFAMRLLINKGFSLDAGGLTPEGKNQVLWNECADLLNRARNLATQAGLPGIYFVLLDAPANQHWVDGLAGNGGFDAVTGYYYHKPQLNDGTDEGGFTTSWQGVVDNYKQQWDWMLNRAK